MLLGFPAGQHLMTLDTMLPTMHGCILGFAFASKTKIHVIKATHGFR